jgi:hypothetical protein
VKAATLCANTNWLGESDDEPTAMYKGYGVWLWHTGNEWSYELESAKDRAEAALFYIDQITKCVEMAITEKPVTSPTRGMVKVPKVLLGRRHLTANEKMMYAPSAVVFDLEHHYLGSRSGSASKSLNFVNYLGKELKKHYPHTKLIVTTYNDATSYAKVNRKDNDRIDFELDYIQPQAYHAGYQKNAKSYFVDRRASIAQMGLKSWISVGRVAFPTLKPGIAKRIVPIGMPFMAKAYFEGRKLSGKSPSSDRTKYSTWGLYIMKGPACGGWWSDPIMNWKMKHLNSADASHSVITNYDMLPLYYKRMKELGYGVDAPITTADNLLNSVSINENHQIRLNQLKGRTLIPDVYVAKPDSMSDLAFNILKELNMAHEYYNVAGVKGENSDVDISELKDPDRSTRRQLVARSVINFDLANFLSALSYSKRASLTLDKSSVNHFETNNQLQTDGYVVREISKGIFSIDLVETIKNKDDTSHNNFPLGVGDKTYNLVVYPSDSIKRTLRDIFEQSKDMSQGNRVSFKFDEGFSITVAEKGDDGSYSRFHRVPLTTGDSIDVEAVMTTFSDEGEEELL